MRSPRLIRTLALAVATLSTTLLTGTPASAASADTTPPTVPLIGYAQGFYCLTLIIGVNAAVRGVRRW
jgi:hypothetical protein